MNSFDHHLELLERNSNVDNRSGVNLTFGAEQGKDWAGNATEELRGDVTRKHGSSRESCEADWRELVGAPSPLTPPIVETRRVEPKDPNGKKSSPFQDEFVKNEVLKLTPSIAQELQKISEETNSSGSTPSQNRDSAQTPIDFLSRMLGNESALIELKRAVKRGAPPPNMDPTLEQIASASSPELAKALAASRLNRSGKDDSSKLVRFRYTENATSSKYCHICGRPAHSVKVVVCQNFVLGICRKVVCQICFGKHKWEWPDGEEKEEDWLCPHCRGECPERAQCFNYQRTNRKRKSRVTDLEAAREAKLFAVRSRKTRSAKEGTDNSSVIRLAPKKESETVNPLSPISPTRPPSEMVSPLASSSAGVAAAGPPPTAPAQLASSSLTIPPPLGSFCEPAFGLCPEDLVGSPMSKLTITHLDSPDQALDFYLDHADHFFPDINLDAPSFVTGTSGSFNLNDCFSGHDLDIFP